MERAVTSYAKFNNVNVENEQSVPYDLIVVQPFTATQDPSVLGIKPIPNIDKKISDLIANTERSLWILMTLSLRNLMSWTGKNTKK